VTSFKQTANDFSGYLHTALVRNLFVPLFERQATFRRSRVKMMSAVDQGLRFRRAAEQWSTPHKRIHILNRLRAVVRDAQCHTPYYQSQFSSIGFNAEDDFSFSDFARLPVLEREDVIAHENDLIARNIECSRLKLDSTGGSTGEPVRVWLGPEELGWRASGTEFYQRRVGVLPGLKTALLWGHNLDPVDSGSLKDRFVAFALNLRWFDCFRLSPAVLECYHTQMQAWRPECIIAYAGALADLAEYVLLRGYQPNYPRVCSVTGAEKLYPQQRRLIEQAFGKVYERYGGRDIGLIAFQSACTGDSSMEIDWANLLVEPETNEADSPLLVTKLNADGMPMIRYRVGDVAHFPAGSQPGHPTFCISEVLGRTADRICLPTGKWITGLQFPHMMKSYPVREFMLVQRPDYSIDLQIVPTIGFKNDDQQAILTTVSANLPGLDLRIAVVPRIERTQASKLRPVVSQVPHSRSSSNATIPE
jgi:phenylacetate-CoA ligase